jgi:hypothetical protein
METRTEVCSFTIVVTRSPLDCLSISTAIASSVVDSPRRALAIRVPRFVCNRGPGAALGCIKQAQQTIGSTLLFSNVVIVISGNVVVSANVRAKKKLGKRRTYSGRRNIFLRPSLEFAPVSKLFSKPFPKNFSKLFQTFWKKWLWKKFGKKWFRPQQYFNFLFYTYF